MCVRQAHIVARFRAPCLTSIATKGHTMITIEKAKATADILVKRYPDLISAAEIVNNAIQDNLVTKEDALPIWARVRRITKTN